MSSIFFRLPWPWQCCFNEDFDATSEAKDSDSESHTFFDAMAEDEASDEGVIELTLTLTSGNILCKMQVEQTWTVQRVKAEAQEHLQGPQILSSLLLGTQVLANSETVNSLGLHLAANEVITAVVGDDSLKSSRVATTKTGDEKSIVWLRSCTNGELLQTFRGHTDEVLSVAMTQDGVSLLTSSRDRTAKLWEVATGDCTATFAGHRDVVSSAKFSADGAYILTASNDTTSRLWCSKTGECTQTFCHPGQGGHTSGVTSAIFGKDGLSVFTAASFVARMWSTQTGECLQHFVDHAFEDHEDHDVSSIAISNDGALLLTGSRIGWPTSKLWSIETGDCIHTFDGCFDISVFDSHSVFSPDGSKVLTTRSQQRRSASSGTMSFIHVSNTHSGEREFWYEKGISRGVAFSLCGRYIMAAEDRTLRMFDYDEGEEISTIISSFDCSDGEIVLAVFPSPGAEELVA